MKDEYTRELLNCKWLKEACRNIGKDYHEDLYQEFWVIFLSFSNEKLESIRNLRFFCVRILLNISNDKSDRWLKRNVHSELPENLCIEQPDQLTDSVFKLKEAIINRLPMYERVLFRLHERGMSYRAIASDTGIDRNEVRNRLNQVKEIIKNAANHI